MAIRPKNDNASTVSSQIKSNTKSAKDWSDVVKDIEDRSKQLVKDLQEGNIQLEEFDRKYKELVRDADEYSKRQAEALEFLERHATFIANRDRLTEKMVRKAKEENAVRISEYTKQAHIEEDILKIQRARSLVYAQRDVYENNRMNRLNAQQALQTELLQDENSSDEERQKAAEKLLDTTRKIYRLEKEREERQEQKKRSLERAARDAVALEEGFDRTTTRGYLQGKKQDFAEGLRGLFHPEEEGQDDKKSNPIVNALGVMTGKLTAGNLKTVEVLKDLKGAFLSGFTAINNIIDSAAESLSKTMGPVNAALEGTGRTFEDIRTGLIKGIGTSPLVKTTDILGSIQNLVQSGVTTDLESIAILSTIRDKTVASFNATDGNLRRLIRLNQQRGNLTAQQFGLAAVLKEELNRYFGDNSFIADQFQSLTGSILDMLSANAQKSGIDSTGFYSILESWAGGMYESGVDSNTISAIAQGINYLGSGNINALSGNKTLQNLLLLSMDQAGLDYATILQRGLNESDTYALLSKIIDYLADIADKTGKNNVLQSSYANLFNLSISDMKAIQNLRQSHFFENQAGIVSGKGAMQETVNELMQLGNERTMLNEVIENFRANAGFNFGSGVASSKWAYPLFLGSRMGMNLGKALEAVPFVGKGLQIFSGITWGLSMLSGLDDLIGGLKPNFEAIGKDTTLSNYFTKNVANTGGAYSGGTSMSLTVNMNGNKNTLPGFAETDEGAKRGESMKSYSEENQSAWESDTEQLQEDANTKILKEFEKTLMKANESEGYAFAVSLQGMSDGVLRSFASIFADEDAMMETLTGKNNALEKNNTFIDYVNDTSSKQGAGKGNVVAAAASAVRSANR